MLEEIDLGIFWSENRAYILLYCVYALLVLALVSYFERKLQLSDGAGSTVASANAVIWVLSVVLFALGMFVTGWLSDLFGGEVGAFVVTLFASFAALFFAGRWCLDHFGIRLGSPNLVCGWSSVALLTPYVAFHVFVFILGSADWRH